MHYGTFPKRNSAKVADVGQPRARDDLDIQSCEKVMGVVALKRRTWIASAVGRILQAVRADDGAGHFSRADEVTCITGQRLNPFGPVQRQSKRKAELRIGTGDLYGQLFRLCCSHLQRLTFQRIPEQAQVATGSLASAAAASERTHAAFAGLDHLAARVRAFPDFLVAHV